MEGTRRARPVPTSWSRRTRTFPRQRSSSRTWKPSAWLRRSVRCSRKSGPVQRPGRLTPRPPARAVGSSRWRSQGLGLLYCQLFL